MELRLGELLVIRAFVQIGLSKVPINKSTEEGLDWAKQGLDLLNEKIDREAAVRKENKTKEALKAQQLDLIIEQIKEKFPDYIYINGITGDCREKHMLPADSTDYAIFIKGVPEGKSGEITNYVYDDVYMKMAETGQELPSIFTFHEKD